jgi:DNA repair protein RecN (Recombination protein N)
MLRQLYIQNYAIIEEINIFFSPALNIITGETGAGKSILVGAMGLILGERADTQVLFDKEKKCIVEGIFHVREKAGLTNFFETNDLETGEEIIVRREISTIGKSRAFINDTPVNLSQLQQLSNLLVDLHQQFYTIELEESIFQLQVVDALADHKDKVDAYRIQFMRYTRIRKQLEQLIVQQAGVDKELDYNNFLFKEFEEVNLKGNEIEDLEAELKILSNAEGIKTVLDRINNALYESEQPIVQQLKSLTSQLQQLSEYHHQIPFLVQRLHSSQIELKDISGEINHINETIQIDAQRLELVKERLDHAYRLLKKHSVQTTAELLSIQSSIQQRLNQVAGRQEEISKLEGEINIELKKAKELAEEISIHRKAQIQPLQKKVEAQLARIGMPNARLKISIQDSEMNIHGKDRVEFLFDANKSNRYEPLRKVASGGELSRLMLTIKSLVAKLMQLPTLIFDEIDSGISGEAAKQVGSLMKELGLSHQVISITHQPQIAAKADTHFVVYKKDQKGIIKTHVRQLSNDERVEAIAHMLGGEKPTAVVFENAREMVTGG